MHSCFSVKCEGAEPNSVLDNPRSPSSSTAWPWAAADLEPVPDAVLDNITMEDWEDMFADDSDNKIHHNVINFSSESLQPFHTEQDSLLFPVHLEEKPKPQPQSQPVNSPTFLPAHRHQALLDQLLHAAELAEAGDPTSVTAILARLNHQLPSPPGQPPLLRTAYYFKEALQRAVAGRSPATADVLVKLGAYKDFSEVSPILHFSDFTCTQALLEAVRGADRIHIVDFDIGVGGQWASFIKELAGCRPSPILMITVIVSALSTPFELHLTRDSLYHFAAGHGIPFELRYLSAFDPSGIVSVSGEVVAVNLPAAAVCSGLLRLVRKLAPKITVSVDHGCSRSDLPFAHYFLHSLQSSVVMLDSIDAAGASADVGSRIERCLLQPRIEEGVIGRYRAGERTLPWRMLFASAGFSPVHFSDFAEAQAECLMKRVPVRGFHVEKRHASMFLHWQHRELASVSAWRC